MWWEKLEDILTRFGNKIANDAEQNKAGQGGRDCCPIVIRCVTSSSPTSLDWAVKDDRHSVEHPFFRLAKKDLETWHYEHNRVSITITPNAEYGRA